MSWTRPNLFPVYVASDMRYSQWCRMAVRRGYLGYGQTTVNTGPYIRSISMGILNVISSQGWKRVELDVTGPVSRAHIAMFRTDSHGLPREFALLFPMPFWDRSSDWTHIQAHIATP